MSVSVLLLAVGLGIAAPSVSVPTSVPDSPTATSARAGMDQPKPKEKRFGGSASCTIECTGPNGTICRQINASCGLSFDTELAAKNYLSGQLNLQAAGQGGRVTSGISFNISWRWSD